MCRGIGQLPHTIRVAATDLLPRLELDLAAEIISGKLANEAALGTISLYGTPPEPARAALGSLLPSLQDQRWQIESHGSGSQRPR